MNRKLGLAPEELMREMKLLSADGRLTGGVEAFIEIGRAILWARPMTWVFHVPGFRALAAAGYAKFAARRHCIGGACARKPSGSKR